MLERHRLVLRTATQRILPSDDGPGAAEAGVAEYVEATLNQSLFLSWKPLFERGLEAIEAIAFESFQQPFADCSPPRQDEVLRRFQASADAPLQAFFRQLVVFCLEGFLCRPNHGGNRLLAGWAYVGHPPSGIEERCLKTPRHD